MNSKRSVLASKFASVLFLFVIGIGLSVVLYLAVANALRADVATTAISPVSKSSGGSTVTSVADHQVSAPETKMARTSTSSSRAGEGPLVVSIKDRMLIGPAQPLLNKLLPEDTTPSALRTAMAPVAGGEDEPEDRERGIYPFEAQRFRNLQMQDENGVIPADAYDRARDQVATMKAWQQDDATSRGMTSKLKVAGINSASWAWLGPGNIGGRIRSMVIDPANANSIWVGSVSGGIWHTSDAGASWLPVNDFMANLAVSSLVIDPSNPNVMYAGTGESYAAGGAEGEDISTNGLRGDGIFKSVDRGVTWSRMPNTRPNDPAVCPAAGPNCPWSYVNRLSIASNGQSILAATANGIEITSNGGVLWQTGINAASGLIEDIDFDPLNPQNAVAGLAGGSMYSTDGGNAWTAATFTTAIAPNGASGRVEMAYAPSNPLIVYASVHANGPNATPPYTIQGQVYKSLNGGHTFDLVNATLPGNTFLGDQGGYGNIIWVNPIDANCLIVGGINMYRSLDGGLTWTAIANGANGSAHSDHHMIVASPAFNDSTNKQVYFANDGGVYRADDVRTVSLTSGWTKLNNNLGITQFYSGATTAGGNIIGGTQDNGTVKFNGASVPWTETFSGDGGFVAADPVDPNYVYGEYTILTVRRSTNGGASGPFIFCNPAATSGFATCDSPSMGIRDANKGANFIAPIVLDPGNSSRMLAGGLSLWETRDLKSAGIPSWAPVKDPTLTTRPGSVLGVNDPISAIAVSSNNPDFIVVGHNDGQIFITFNGTNAPATWNRISNAGVPAPARYVTRLVIDETRSPNWIYATFGGFAGDNIYCTKNLGNTWIDVSGEGPTSIPSAPVRSLQINPIHRDYLYAGTELGVFASEDGGVTWKLPQDGPANVSVDELFWYNGRLAAATFGRGVYVTAPLFASNGGSGSGGGGSGGTSCNTAGSGNWADPLSWPVLGRVPNSSDDIAVVCPVTVTSSAEARSVRVNSNVSLNATLYVGQDLSNFGTIQRNVSLPGTASISVKNFSNSGNVSVNDVSATGEVVNGDTMNVTGNLQSGNLRNAGTMTVQGVTVSGDLDNSGSMTGTGSLAFTGTTHNLQGSGQLKFASGSVPSGQTARFVTDMTFDIASFNANGTMDFNGKTLKFLGNAYSGGGTVVGTGTLRLEPTFGTVVLGGNAPAVNIVSGFADYQSGGTFTGPLTVGSATTFKLDAAAVTLKGDATVNGTITRETTFGGNVINFFGGTFTNNGGITADSVRFNPSGPVPIPQIIAGLGQWSGDLITIGNASAAAPSTVTLQNDVTFAAKEIQVGYTFNLNGHVLSYTGTGNQSFVAVTNSGSIAGPGTFRLQPASGTPIIRSLNPAATWGSALKIASGSVRTDTNFANFVVTGPLTVDAGATFRLNGTGADVRGNVVNSGTINLMPSSFAALTFRGTTFANNGFIDAANVYFLPLAAQQMQLSGSGTWTGAGSLYFDPLSDTSFTSDVTYGSGTLQTYGALHGVDPAVFSVPCTVSWTGPGEVTGNLRRTNLASCPGAAVSYGNPFTTILFNSGTPPSDVLVSVQSSPLVPAGFPGAVRRLYTITPTGGSGFTATLRLHYLDSELNGNDESTLELFRFDGSVWTSQGASSRSSTNNWVEYSGVTQFSPWAIAGPQAPTAAGVSIAGQVRTFSGIPIQNAVIALVDAAGTARIARTGPFGYYRFDDVPAGATYVASVSAKGFVFSQSSVLLAVSDDLAEYDFVAGQVP